MRQSFKSILGYAGFMLGSLHATQRGEARSLLPELPAGWTEVKPGGETICARGEEYSFFVNPGKTNKVVIDFIGGGACWNSFTCAKETATFTDSVDGLKRRQEEGLEGIYDRDRPDNPLKDWYHVVVPYCTGDIHWGNNRVTYTKDDGTSFAINHKGAINAKAVLKWVEEKFASPKRVLVTGCSAGSYGSLYWTPAIRKMFPRSAFYQLGDSGAGVITNQFFQTSFPLWKAIAEGPTWVPGLNPEEVDWLDLTIIDLYRIIGNNFNKISLSQFNTSFDENQTFYFEIMGGSPELWSPKLFESLAKIDESTPSFRHFTAPGENHCIIPYDRFYTTKSNGIYFKDWFKAYINGQNPDSVTCVDCDPSGVGS